MAEEKKVELKEESMEDVAGGCFLDSSKELKRGLLDSSKELKGIVIDNKNKVLDREKFERKIDLGSEDK